MSGFDDDFLSGPAPAPAPSAKGAAAAPPHRAPSMTSMASVSALVPLNRVLASSHQKPRTRLRRPRKH